MRRASPAGSWKVTPVTGHVADLVAATPEMGGRRSPKRLRSSRAPRPADRPEPLVARNNTLRPSAVEGGLKCQHRYGSFIVKLLVFGSTRGERKSESGIATRSVRGSRFGRIL